MKMKILEKGNNSILLEFRDTDIGFCYAIVKQLLTDKRVLNAWANKPHPLEPIIKMYILTDGTVTPKNALQEALSKIENSLQELKQEFINALNK
ncbi:MAG: RpoL/Rpb11 RNA polymerase subunit family protein [Thermoprotei archaeon]